jgi:hypothetical protein
VLAAAAYAQAPQRSRPQAAPPARSSTLAAAGVSAGAESPRLAALTPAGLSPREACTGFESIRECAAALHLAQNLSVPFTDLKARVTAGESLEAALGALKPDVATRSEVRKAEQEARADMRAPSG